MLQAQRLPLDDSQADRYYPDSRMTLSIIKNIERKEVNTFMELKHVIPNMERTFENLEFAGENKVEQRRINGRMTVVSPYLQPLFGRAESR